MSPFLAGNPYLGEPLARGKIVDVGWKLSVFHLYMYCILTDKLNVIINDSVSPIDTEQITTFMDGNPSWRYEVPHTPDVTASTINDSNETLENFFSRPIRIYTANWGLGVTLFENFDPWTLFWENKRNLNRITNYNLLRCRLHVSFKINGNAFHYGRLIASYCPFQGVVPLDDITIDRAFYTEDVIQASQRPHVYLDPTTNAGGEMVLPFFWFKNYLSIPDMEWEQMGSITVSTLQNLKHANGATDTVTIQVYAWATEVEFGVPTSRAPANLAPQAEPERERRPKKQRAPSGESSERYYSKGVDPPADEYNANAGMISKPLSTFAKIAGMLENAPIIGPYAKATQIAASGAANIAKIFGYSRPVQIEGTRFFKNQYVGDMANTNSVDLSTKLALDIKQETTIDSRVAGLDGTDEMLIKSIAMRESYLTYFPWTLTNVPDDPLFLMNVSPVMFDILTGPPDEYHMTPSCFASQLFRFWHGTMEVRFQFVCSKYHKGRVKIMYDPYAINSAIGGAEDNINYTQVVDLSLTRDVTIKVPWGQTLHWLNTHNIANGGGSINFNVGTATLGRHFGNAYNGQLAVYVLNELTVPNSTINNDIQVNVFTKMCDDFCLMNPTGSRISDLTYFPQATPEMEDDYVGDECDDAPMTQESVELAPSFSSLDPQFFDVYPGESVESLRSLLKRYSYHMSYGPGTNSYGTLSISQGIFPFYRGSPDGAYSTSTTPAGPWNYCSNTFLNYITPAFAGWRGGLRWKVIRDSTTSSSGFLTYVSRIADSASAPSYYGVTWDTMLGVGAGNVKTVAYDSYFRLCPSSGTLDANTSMDGTVINRISTGAVEAEFPWYSNLRFFPAKQQNQTTQGPFRGFWYAVMTMFQGANSIESANFYCATAEDFNLFFFTGAPIVYIAQTPLP